MTEAEACHVMQAREPIRCSCQSSASGAGKRGAGMLLPVAGLGATGPAGSVEALKPVVSSQTGHGPCLLNFCSRLLWILWALHTDECLFCLSELVGFCYLQPRPWTYTQALTNNPCLLAPKQLYYFCLRSFRNREFGTVARSQVRHHHRLSVGIRTSWWTSLYPDSSP